MPAPKKKSTTTAKKPNASKSTTSSKNNGAERLGDSHKQRPTREQSSATTTENRQDHPDSKLNTPPGNTPKPNSSSDDALQMRQGTMPMPVRPQHLPAKHHSPLTRTTYNTGWIKYGLIGGVSLIVLGGGFLVWQNRNQIFTQYKNDYNQPEAYQLHITPTPTPNQQKLIAIDQDLNGYPESSSSSEPEFDYATAKSELESYAKDRELSELEDLLADSVANLKALGVNTVNLEAYQQKISGLESEGEIDRAKELTIEAITHAREQEYSYRYYQ